MILTAKTLKGDLHLKAEVCVVGSGAGGAVVAKELAEAGRDVVLLEQGGHYTKEDFTQREEEMMPLLFEEMGQRSTEDGSILILQGRNIGGSTVHNLCYCFRTPRPIVEKWRREDGIRWNYEELLPSLERVEKMLHVQPIAEAQVNTLNRKIREGCEKLGFHGIVAHHNRVNCTSSGFCILGCPFDAKQSMALTYIPAADRAGARIYANCAVEKLEIRGGQVRAVEGSIVDERGAAYGHVRVEARLVVLSAGAINGPQILLRSSGGGSATVVGKHLHLHPSVLLAGIYDEDIYGYLGIPQSYYVDEFIDLERNPDSGYIIMPIFGFPVATAAQLPGFGSTHAKLMRSYHRMVGILVLLHDQSEGDVRLGSDGHPRIRYQLRNDEQALMAEGMRHCAEILFASGAKEVVVPYYRSPLWLKPGDDLSVIEQRGCHPGEIPLASTHPQGTCRMGEDPTRSVVNSWGQSHEVKNLFVADMGLFPSSLGAPPQITTAALADMVAHFIKERWASLCA
ncbi:MAG: GMC family oxidoreductase [Candidatus Binatia bacterium]|nr:GMC family oxidoreductase [Candidatus Binatia bacterium]